MSVMDDRGREDIADLLSNGRLQEADATLKQAEKQRKEQLEFDTIERGFTEGRVSIRDYLKARKERGIR